MNHYNNFHNYRMCIFVRWICIPLLIFSQRSQVTRIGHLFTYFNYSPINNNILLKSIIIRSKIYNIITIFVWIVSNHQPPKKIYTSHV